MDIQKKRVFLINCTYWAVIIAGAYLALDYLLPVFMPCILGILLAWVVVWISGKLRCRNKIFRICLSVLVYGVIGLLIAWLIVKGVDGISGLVNWLPQFYELKLQPLVMLTYSWAVETLEHLDPALISALESVLESLLSGLKNLVSIISGFAVNLVSGLATGIPSLIFSLLTMIFSTIFVVADYEHISAFAGEHTPRKVKTILKKVRIYLTGTLFVVIRYYIMIMLLTFSELSILFSVFGIENPVLKAALIAVFDIMPILGTGGIMIPWAVISLVLGYTKLGIELFIIYGIVTVIRNYVEPKIVGSQLGLHPIITLVSMFVGLRLFGFWGLFGLPVGISFLWKEKLERDARLKEAVE